MNAARLLVLLDTRLLAVAATCVALGLQSDLLFQSEGMAGLILILLAGLTLFRTKQSAQESDTSTLDWLATLSLLVPVALLLVSDLTNYIYSANLLLASLVFFALLLSHSLSNRAFLKAVFMLWIMFLIVPALGAMEAALSYPMRRLSSLLAYGVLLPFEQAIELQGTELRLANLRLNITEACDGLNLMQNLLWIIWLNGMLKQRSGPHQLLCFALKSPLVLVINTFRILVLAVLVYAYGPEVLAGDIHLYSGWVAVVCAALAFFYLDGKIASETREVGAENDNRIGTKTA